VMSWLKQEDPMMVYVVGPRMTTFSTSVGKNQGPGSGNRLISAALKTLSARTLRACRDKAVPVPQAGKGVSSTSSTKASSSGSTEEEDEQYVEL